MKNFKKVVKFGAASLAVVGGHAMAAATDATTALAGVDAGQADITSIGWAMVGLCIVVAVFRYMKRAA
ncbi:hypothetical protein VST7929_03035 [Vibrio stylophorae]|uniref:Phage coat protein n=1 Tax=Vibrio stylophorae TaxID=659351 RepID=A0ABM8ZXK7_9VIBR|nr:major capsid protein [Vibrio stylophorae]CAH0535461.1 hypothetical protein VST7929_03035 [Vibrio stylophorae]